MSIIILIFYINKCCLKQPTNVFVFTRAPSPKFQKSFQFITKTKFSESNINILVTL